DWQILLELAARLEAARDGASLTRWLKRAFLHATGPDGIVRLLVRLGPHGPGLFPFRRGLTLGRLKKQPHGVDLGPLEPSLPGRRPGSARWRSRSRCPTRCGRGW